MRRIWGSGEAGLAYAVRTVPFEDRETNHPSRQPFGRIPFLSDGDLLWQRRYGRPPSVLREVG